MKKDKIVKFLKEIGIYIVAFFLVFIFSPTIWYGDFFRNILFFAIFCIVVLILKFFVRFFQQKGIIKKSFKIQ